MAFEKRQPLCIVVCGKKDSGKTFETLLMILETVKGNRTTGVKPRKVLIIDVNGEFTQFKTIPLNYVKTYSSSPLAEVRRLTVIKKNGKKMTSSEISDMLDYVLNNYTNGLLLVEDITKYIADSFKKDVIGAICTNRHAGLDLILHFQLIRKAAHPKLLGNINLVRLHKVAGKVTDKQFEDYYEIMRIAQLIVNLEHQKGEKSKFYKPEKRDPTKKRIFFSVYVNFDTDKIFGEFDKSMFADAVHKYINENKKTTINLYLDERDEYGNKLYKNYHEAYLQVQKDFMTEYYGNPK